MVSTTLMLVGKAVTCSKPSVVMSHHVYKAVWTRDSRGGGGGAPSMPNVSDVNNLGGGGAVTRVEVL